MKLALRLLVLPLMLLGLPSSAQPPSTPAAVAPPDVRSIGFLHQAAYEPLVDREALLASYATLIRDLHHDFGKLGSIVEALAHAHFLTIYPTNDFEIIPNVTYQDPAGRTLGELDIVVFERATGEAVLVVETKASARLRRAGQEAAAQLHRFRYCLEAGLIDNFSYGAPFHRAIRPEHFLEVTEYVRVGPDGALGAGFDYEADIRPEEIEALRSQVRTAVVTP